MRPEGIDILGRILLEQQRPHRVKGKLVHRLERVPAGGEHSLLVDAGRPVDLLDTFGCERRSKSAAHNCAAVSVRTIAAEPRFPPTESEARGVYADMEKWTEVCRRVLPCVCADREHWRFRRDIRVALRPLGTQKDGPTPRPRCAEANQHPSHACGCAIDRPILRLGAVERGPRQGAQDHAGQGWRFQRLGRYVADALVAASQLQVSSGVRTMNMNCWRTMAAAGWMLRAAACVLGVGCLATSVSAEEGPLGPQLTIEAGDVQIQIAVDNGIEGDETVGDDPDAEPEVAEEIDEFPMIMEDAQQVAPAWSLGGLFGAGLRAIFDVVAPEPQVAEPPLPLNERDDGEMPKDPRAAQLWQQRKQIREQAKNMEQALQPALRTELEMVRRSCGSLSPEARREVLAAGRAAVASTALTFATRQMKGGLRRQPMAMDVRREIQEPLAKAVERHAPVSEFAAYQREQQLRWERRQRAARVAIVTKLDRQLDLAEAQRRAIEVDLEQHWEASWMRALDDHRVIMNNERPAPDYADACIAPHLDHRQQAEWRRWRKVAGFAVTGGHGSWNFDGQGLHQEDNWWKQ